MTSSHPALESHLAGLEAGDEPKAYLCPGLAAQRASGRSGLSRKFLELMRAAGVDAGTVAAEGERRKRDFSRRSFHSLRHTFNSWLADRGVNQELRMALVGHASEAMNRRYTHRQVERFREVVGLLPAI